MGKLALAAPISLALVAGCGTSPYKKQFHRIPSAPTVLAPCREGEPGVNTPSDPQAEGERLRGLGYLSIGYVSFKGVVPDPARDPDILAQARRVGACRVVLSSNRHGSRDVGYGPEDRRVAVYEVSAIFFAKPKESKP